MSKANKVLITGGSGLVGKYLTSLLLAEGYIVKHLSRRQNSFGTVRVHQWDPDKGIADDTIFNDIDFIIHLAGENLSGKRWSARQKEIIMRSRVDSARLLFEKIHQSGHKLKAFISASAVGYYGSVTSERIFKEDDPPSDDFLGSVCKAWEDAADLFASSCIRTVKIRSGVVLEKNSGVLASLLVPAHYGIFSYPGKGNHYLSWIHIKDLCAIYIKALQDEEMSGAYNAVAPHYTQYRRFMQTLAMVKGKRFFHPPLPGFLLKLFFGEMSQMILTGSRICPEKIIQAGYSFLFDNPHKALDDLQN